MCVLVHNEDIAGNEYNLAVSSYVEPEDTHEETDIVELNSEIARIVERQSQIRTQLDETIAMLEDSGE